MVVEEKEISQAVVARLPRYLRYLGELRDEGIERVSSQELSDIMQVTASQIRQDLNTFGGFGQQGYGYNVDYLYDEIGKILGLNREHRLIIVGAGHLGQALVNYSNFERRGFLFRGVFDCDPKVCGKKICGILTEMSTESDYIRYVVVGIGINVGVREFPEELRDKATSIYLCQKETVGRAPLAAAVMDAWENYYNIFIFVFLFFLSIFAT